MSMFNKSHRNTVLERARPQLRDLIPYQSARRLFGADVRRLFIDANELPFDPPSPELAWPTYNQYPDISPRELRRAYAEYVGARTEQVLVTRGADEGIELLIRTFAEPGQDAVVYFPPTYGLYEIASTIHGANVIPVALKDDFSLDLEVITTLPEHVRLIFICNPNNPTGNLIPEEDIRRVLDTFRDRAIVAIDEAYMDFCPDKTALKLLPEFDNLVIIRTMSKAFGLAGIHVGYSLAHKALIDLLKKVITPYPIPSPCADIALQALSADGLARLEHNRRAIDASRTMFVQGLNRFASVEAIYPSVGNFVLVKFKNAIKTFDDLVAHDVIARSQCHIQSLGDCIRFSIGNEEQMGHVLRVLKRVENIDRSRSDELYSLAPAFEPS